MTASATRPRSSCEVSRASFASASSSERSEPSSETLRSETSSLKSRPQALTPVRLFSAEIFSSGSESWCGL